VKSIEGILFESAGLNVSGLWSLKKNYQNAKNFLHYFNIMYSCLKQGKSTGWLTLTLFIPALLSKISRKVGKEARKACN